MDPDPSLNQKPKNDPFCKYFRSMFLHVFMCLFINKYIFVHIYEYMYKYIKYSTGTVVYIHINIDLFIGTVFVDILFMYS